jgi:hypothetical protein
MHIIAVPDSEGKLLEQLQQLSYMYRYASFYAIAVFQKEKSQRVKLHKPNIIFPPLAFLLHETTKQTIPPSLCLS